MKTKSADKSGTAAMKGGGKKKILLLAAPLVVVAIGAGLWFGGILPPLLGFGRAAHATSEAHGDGHATAGDPARKGEPAKPPTFLDLPEMIANLNAGPRRTAFLKLRVKLELERADDQAVATAGMPRLIDLFQTYLRELRPEELKGAAGTYRLREELIARANIAIVPAHIIDVLFLEMLVQ